MHGNGYALLLGNNELHLEFGVIHIPQLDHTILARRGYQIVLIKLVQATR